jgi:hypothetical protein
MLALVMAVQESVMSPLRVFAFPVLDRSYSCLFYSASSIFKSVCTFTKSLFCSKSLILACSLIYLLIADLLWLRVWCSSIVLYIFFVNYMVWFCLCYCVNILILLFICNCLIVLFTPILYLKSINIYCIKLIYQSVNKFNIYKCTKYNLTFIILYFDYSICFFHSK